MSTDAFNTSTRASDQGSFADTLRNRVGAGRPDHMRAAALPGHLQRLARSTVAAHAEADPRDTRTLARDAEKGDRDAETALYVRVAADLERVASKIPGDSALSREDLHQEGAARLIESIRAGIVSERFGGNVGAFIGRALRADLREMALANRPGAPSIAPHHRRHMYEALTTTAREDGSHDVFAASQFMREKYECSLSTFWAIYSTMFAESSAWDTPTAGELTAAEVTADPACADNFARVEDRDTVRRIRAEANLTDREAAVIDAVTDGTARRANVGVNADAAERLGMPLRTLERVKATALLKLRAAAQRVGAAMHYAPDMAPATTTDQLSTAA